MSGLFNRIAIKNVVFVFIISCHHVLEIGFPLLTISKYFNWQFNLARLISDTVSFRVVLNLAALCYLAFSLSWNEVCFESCLISAFHYFFQACL